MVRGPVDRPVPLAAGGKGTGVRSEEPGPLVPMVAVPPEKMGVRVIVAP